MEWTHPSLQMHGVRKVQDSADFLFILLPFRHYMQLCMVVVLVVMSLDTTNTNLKKILYSREVILVLNVEEWRLRLIKTALEILRSFGRSSSPELSQGSSGFSWILAFECSSFFFLTVWSVSFIFFIFSFIYFFSVV